jgi:RNA polymerase sigma-70 factor (ECF subfamily)
MTLRRRYGDEVADDLVQETYLRLASASASQPIRFPKALLSSVASNLARDQGRRAAVASRAANVFALDHRSGEPASEADQLELLLYKQILGSMPAVYRDVYVLNRFAGLTYGQIAQHCAVSVKVVEWRMSQALAHCAQHLRD